MIRSADFAPAFDVASVDWNALAEGMDSNEGLNDIVVVRAQPSASSTSKKTVKNALKPVKKESLSSERIDDDVQFGANVSNPFPGDIVPLAKALSGAFHQRATGKIAKRQNVAKTQQARSLLEGNNGSRADLPPPLYHNSGINKTKLQAKRAQKRKGNFYKFCDPIESSGCATFKCNKQEENVEGPTVTFPPPSLITTKNGQTSVRPIPNHNGPKTGARQPVNAQKPGKPVLNPVNTAQPICNLEYKSPLSWRERGTEFNPNKKAAKKMASKPLDQHRSLLEVNNPLAQDHMKKVSICSYNVLCEPTRIRCQQLYTKNDQAHCHWEARWPKIQAEISKVNATIYCLQEVEAARVPAFNDFFAQYRLQTEYVQRAGGNPDGCMIAYRADLYKPLFYTPIYYNRSARGFDKDNVAQLIHLEEIASGLRFAVANTHILFNMRRGDLKLGQLTILMAEIDKHDRTWAAHENFVGHFLCGDFNMEPHSPLYRFVREGQIDLRRTQEHILPLHVDKHGKNNTGNARYVDIAPTLVGINYQCQEVVWQGRPNYSAESLNHRFKFGSAYAHVASEFENDWCRWGEVSTRHMYYACPDFIFYQLKSDGEESRIHLEKRMRLPRLTEIDSTCGVMPNDQCGSDHIALLAEFRIH